MWGSIGGVSARATRLSLEEHLGGLPPEGLEIRFTRFNAEWIGSTLVIEAAA
jgi:hypothetical protein